MEKWKVVYKDIPIWKKLHDGCFSGDTLVNTESGLKSIKDIVVGDKVLSKNQDTGEVSILLGLIH